MESSKQKLKVTFGPSVTRWNDILGQAIHAVFDVEYCEDEPDLIFVSDTDPPDPRASRCCSILVAIENSWPDFNLHNGGLIFLHKENTRVMRLPLYSLSARPEELIKDDGYTDRVLNENRKFCAFASSNQNPFRTKRRVDFFTKLNAKKHVDSGGSFMNNIQRDIADLRDFYPAYRFVISMENQDWPGYTTEKLVSAMRCGCIPIYWGNRRVAEDFNTKSFINLHDFSSDREAINHIIEVYHSEELTRKYLDEPFFHGNQPGQWFDIQRVSDFIVRIMQMPAPQKSIPYAYHRIFRMQRKIKPYLDPVLPTR